MPGPISEAKRFISLMKVKLEIPPIFITKTFLFFRNYPKVEKGSLVYVGTRHKKIRKEQKPINWYKIITDTLAIVVSGLTVYALINSLN